MSRQRLTAAATAALLLVVIIGISIWYIQGPQRGPAREEDSPTVTGRDIGAAASSTGEASIPKFPAGAPPDLPAIDPVAPTPLTNPDDRSPLADELNRPENTGIQDLEIVHGLFAAYRERFGGIPTGEDNATIVNALAGNNPRRLAFIERTHPAINPRGELVDRWGMPFFFHIESRDAWEIRSAGADREMYTEDDLRKRSPAPRADSL